ncbi:hypothetical protein CLM74_11075 [Stenotrophomonas sp. MYb57]|nr:hypothetical protein CLM74_11075 [Stenotrophomonas sp. MYb57]
MSNCTEIDHMLRELECQLPRWAQTCTEDEFIAVLSKALDYIAVSANRSARYHCIKRTGCLRPESGEEIWAARYGL